MSMTRIAILAAAALLAGCSGTVLNPWYYGNFEPSEPHNVGVLTSGEPVAGTRPGVPQAVLASMQGHTAFPTDFALLPDGGYSVYRTVIMFNPPSGLPTYALCLDAPPPQGMTPAAAASGGRMTFSAALCRGFQVLSGAYGTMDCVPPADPRFALAVAELTRNLFPPFNPDAQLFGGSNRH
jgi:hypothetical protein